MIYYDNFFKRGARPPLAIRKAMTTYTLFETLDLPHRNPGAAPTGYEKQEFLFTEIIRNGGDTIEYFLWCLDNQICDSKDIDIWFFLQGEIVDAQIERDKERMS